VSNQVYANNREVSCKAAAGKSICAFPDVCFTPPQTPATPPGVPIPYPNTGMASDCTDGSSSVKVSGQEVMLKDKSYFSRSTGDEAGCAPKKGVLTSKNMGKVYFTAWSMDVKVEGENVVRMMDTTTHNHGSVPSNTAPWPYVDEVAAPGITAKCANDMAKEQTACSGCDTPAKACRSAKCQSARKCKLVPYGGSGSPNCCRKPTKQTAHHLVEVHCFSPAGQRGTPIAGFEGYNQNKAPCVCASGPRSAQQHGTLHAVQGQLERAFNQRGVPGTPIGTGGVSNWNYGEARGVGVMAHRVTFPNSECSPDCVQAQLDAYHNQAPPDGPGASDATPVRSDPAPKPSDVLTKAQQQEVSVADAFIMGGL
jgi:hypothetical protein